MSHGPELVNLGEEGTAWAVPLGAAIPPRPVGQRPTWGLTRSLRVVRLARWTPGRERNDPLRLVAREGWPQWWPVQPGDWVARKAKGGKKRKEKGHDPAHD